MSAGAQPQSEEEWKPADPWAHMDHPGRKWCRSAELHPIIHHLTSLENVKKLCKDKIPAQNPIIIQQTKFALNVFKNESLSAAVQYFQYILRWSENNMMGFHFFL